MGLVKAGIVCQKLVFMLIYAKRGCENGQLIFVLKDAGNYIVTLTTKIL